MINRTAPPVHSDFPTCRTLKPTTPYVRLSRARISHDITSALMSAIVHLTRDCPTPGRQEAVLVGFRRVTRPLQTPIVCFTVLLEVHLFINHASARGT